MSKISKRAMEEESGVQTVCERKLASIRIIRNIEAIPGADAIEVANIDGWQCVVKKGVFKEGQQAIYFEIDSLLPITPAFSFLAGRGTKTNADGTVGYLLRTIRLRGTISQGLLLPLSTFPEIDQCSNLCEGDDVTRLLSICKYDPLLSASLDGQARRLFPEFLRKTDEERIQNRTGYFYKYVDEEFEATEKLDGSSMTTYWNNGDAGVCSRNLDLKSIDSEGAPSNNSFWSIYNQLKLGDVFSKLGINIAIQGELVGEGISGNRLKLKGRRFYVFNIWDIDSQTYLLPPARCKLFALLKSKINSEALQHVPIIGVCKYLSMLPTTVALLNFADGDSSVTPGVKREGVVFKSTTTPNLSFKAISNGYLLKHDL